MSVPGSQKANSIAKAGAAPTVVEQAVPKPEDGHLLVKVNAAAVNPIDWKTAGGYLPQVKFPVALGCDGAGEVVALGPNTSGFSVGDRVFFQANFMEPSQHAFQQYTIVDSKLAGRTPQSLSDDEAASIPLGSFTSVTMLYGATGIGFKPAPWEQGGDKLGAGRSIIILGGSTSLGLYAVQLARMSGFHVITSSSSAHHARLQKLGANITLDRHAASSAEYIKALDGRELAGIVNPTSSPDSLTLALDIAQSANRSSQPFLVGTAFSANDEQIKRGQELSPRVEFNRVFASAQMPVLRPVSEPFFAAVGPWIEQGKFVPNEIEVIPGGLKALEVAFKRSSDGVSGVKLVVRPSETQ